jgi:FkbM family methyltransferase
MNAVLRKLLPRRIRRKRILGGPLRGAVIVASWHDYPAAILGYTERALLGWFGDHVRAGETWLDVGAHYGYTAIALSRLVGPAGRVFAFEPMLSTAGHLAQTRGLNRLGQLTVVPFGLGAPRRDVEVRVLATTRGMVDSTVTDGQPESVLVAGLDWLWPQVCGDRERIDGVKLDVQGMEIEVFRGMTRLLKLFTPKLVVEVHRGVDRAEMLELLEAAGYARRGVPIEPDEEVTGAMYLDDRSYAFHRA